MPPKETKKIEISNKRDITVNGYEYVELEGQRFVENEDYNHKRWFYSLMSKMNEKYPQFKVITDKLAYTDKEFRRGLSKYSSTLDAMTVIIAETYDRKRESEKSVKDNIKYNILGDFGRMGLDTSENSKEKKLLDECRRNPSDDFIDYVFDMLSSANKYAKSYGLNDINREEKENVNARCFAMMGMADMIGMSDLVPQVENVQVFHGDKVFKNGILYKSNAQHSVQSSDIEYLVTKDANRDRYPQDSPKSFENIADINVMFWLSGRNPLYITDLGYDIDPVDGSVKFKLISFDSPVDFGSYPADKKAEADAVLDSITMVSRKTAEKIIAVDTQKYRQMLANSGISRKAVDAGVERLEALQAKIRENRLEIVDDWQAQWEKAGLKKLADGLDGAEPVGGIYSSLYRPDEVIGQVRLGRKPEPKAVETIEYFDTYYENKPEDYKNRLNLIGNGDPKLGFYMLQIAATPASNIYPGSGKIKVSRIQENLNSLLNDNIETLDTLKLQILREEAKSKIDEMSRQTPAKRRKFERNLVSVTIQFKKWILQNMLKEALKNGQEKKRQLN